MLHLTLPERGGEPCLGQDSQAEPSPFEPQSVVDLAIKTGSPCVVLNGCWTELYARALNDAGILHVIGLPCRATPEARRTLAREFAWSIVINARAPWEEVLWLTSIGMRAQGHVVSRSSPRAHPPVPGTLSPVLIQRLFDDVSACSSLTRGDLLRAYFSAGMREAPPEPGDADRLLAMILGRLGQQLPPPLDDRVRRPHRLLLFLRALGVWDDSDVRVAVDEALACWHPDPRIAGEHRQLAEAHAIDDGIRGGTAPTLAFVIDAVTAKPHPFHLSALLYHQTFGTSPVQLLLCASMADMEAMRSRVAQLWQDIEDCRSGAFRVEFFVNDTLFHEPFEGWPLRDGRTLGGEGPVAVRWLRGARERKHIEHQRRWDRWLQEERFAQVLQSVPQLGEVDQPLAAMCPSTAEGEIDKRLFDRPLLLLIVVEVDRHETVMRALEAGVPSMLWPRGPIATSRERVDAIVRKRSFERLPEALSDVRRTAPDLGLILLWDDPRRALPTTMLRGGGPR